MSFLGHRRILVVTAVEAERQAVLRALGTDPAVTDAVVVEVGGVGSAAVAATTARVLALGRFDAAMSAGIGGGIGVPVGGTAVATSSIAADLGAESPEGFLSLDGSVSAPVSSTRIRDSWPPCRPRCRTPSPVRC